MLQEIRLRVDLVGTEIFMSQNPENFGKYAYIDRPISPSILHRFECTLYRRKGMKKGFKKMVAYMEVWGELAAR